MRPVLPQRAFPDAHLRALAEQLADEAAALSRRAKEGGLDLVAYLLDMAVIEARRDAKPS